MAVSPRILLLTAYYFPLQGGVETHARALASYLASHGIAVTIVTKRLDAKTPAEETIDGIAVHRVSPAGARNGVRKWLMIPFALWRIITLRRSFDVIYCPGYQGIGIAAMLAGAVLRKPVVLRSGNLGVLYGNNWNAPLARWHISPKAPLVNWLKARIRAIYTPADAFACNCREIEDEALACGVPRARVHYLPNAVDVDRYRPAAPGEKAQVRATEGWPQDALLCLYVGRLSAEKGVMELLQAWRSLPHPNKRLVLIGPDMPGHPLDVGPTARRFVAEHGLTNEVIFYGESNDGARLLRAADLYVQPSHYEAFSNALIEAMATGLPPVATRIGGMLDCIVDEQNGLLATPRDPVDLARQLSRMMDDAGLAARLGANARATVVSDFNVVTIFGKFAELFRAIADRHPINRRV